MKRRVKAIVNSSTTYNYKDFGFHCEKNNDFVSIIDKNGNIHETGFTKEGIKTIIDSALGYLS